MASFVTGFSLSLCSTAPRSAPFSQQRRCVSNLGLPSATRERLPPESVSHGSAEPSHSSGRGLTLIGSFLLG